jgi:hypothetical protein
MWGDDVTVLRTSAESDAGTYFGDDESVAAMSAVSAITMDADIDRGDMEFQVVDSKLSLVDLAGSERATVINASNQYSESRYARQLEGANINRSLLALANCINALAEKSTSKSKKKINVKFRDSKLTLLLKNSLEGKSHLVMIANINPSHTLFEDSLNTLKYANRAKNIKVFPRTAVKTIAAMTEDEVVKLAMREAKLLEERVSLKARIAELEQEVDMLRKLVPFALAGDSGDMDWKQQQQLRGSSSIEVSPSCVPKLFTMYSLSCYAS